MRNFLLSLFFLLLAIHPAFAALAIDGSASTSTGTGPGFTVTLTTTSSNDVIIIFPKTDGLTTFRSVSSVSDVAGLTWTKRTSTAWNTGGLDDSEEWYAVAASPLTSDVITVTYSAALSSAARITAFGISGTNTASPFDANVSLPAIATGSAVSTSVTNTISTSNANDMIINLFALFSGTGFTRPSGYTAVITPGSVTDVSEKIVSTTQSSVAVGYTYGATAAVLITDAVKAASAPSPTPGLLMIIE